MKSQAKIVITIALVLVVAMGLSLSQTLIHLLTESWWFDTVGFVEVFWIRITWQILIWLTTFWIYALFLWANYSLALRLTKERRFTFLEETALEHYTKSIANLIALILIFLVAFTGASTSVPAWEEILKFFNSSKFNFVDPLYQKDIGFYIFKLPLYQDARSWLLNLFVSASILSVTVYILKGQIASGHHWKNWLTGKVKSHLSLLLAAIALLIALGFWLERYRLLYSSEGVVFGAGYTDAHARLFAYSLMSFGALTLGILLILAVWQNSIIFPTYGICFYLVAWILFNNFYPWFQQQFIVEPNELEKELPYIEHNIEFTRKAYGLEEVQRKSYPGHNQLNRQTLQANQTTIDNIRLWDYQPLLDTYRQLQEIRLYYKFNDIDIDRYSLDHKYTQVMLSARELSYAQVPARAKTWVNQRLKYTHGYGLVMSPVHQVTEDGLPLLLIKNIPPLSEQNLEVTEPAIYYGESTDDYIFTGTSTPEFDYALGEENAFTNYQGKGGVPMPGFWRRLAYAYEQGSIKILISQYFTQNSRIHYHRNIQERVRQVAPFLRFDHDPYLVNLNGRLQWIIDAYTVSDRYPYAEPVQQSDNAASILQRSNLGQIVRGNVNYLRNSVKVVIDAYDGTMEFLVVDEEDPVLNTYRRIFPNLFQPEKKIPPAVKAHFRYPLDLFAIQAQMYMSYHMSDPQVFYNQEDLWRFPTQIYEGNEQVMGPYYVIMRLPEEPREEFILIVPFTPVNKNNMIAWLAARSDGQNYGKLLLYEFPKQELVYGPSQIEARIDQEPEISEQLTLWSQEGSRVIRGHLLVVPIEKSLLYIEPIYLRAEKGQLPELKRVIVAYDKEVVMTPSLEESLAAIFGDKSTQKQAPTTEAISNLRESAWNIYQKAQEALRQGNWSEYGRYQQELENLFRPLKQNQETVPDSDKIKRGNNF
jgi:uncharacterized membrane protein (UPF0182 family)